MWNTRFCGGKDDTSFCMYLLYALHHYVAQTLLFTNTLSCFRGSLLNPSNGQSDNILRVIIANVIEPTVTVHTGTVPKRHCIFINDDNLVMGHISPDAFAHFLHLLVHIEIKLLPGTIFLR